MIGAVLEIRRPRAQQRPLLPSDPAAFFAEYDGGPVVVVDSERPDPRRETDLRLVAAALDEARR